MSVITLFLALFSSLWLARAVSKDAVALSPAITLLGWAAFLGIFVGNDIPVSSLWWAFWLLTGTSTLASLWTLRHDRSGLSLIVVPVICAIIVLLPYFIYGIRFYPGSWFWDGFAYLATSETLWMYPRSISAEGLEPLYMLGQSNLNFRFTASALIAVFRNVLPIGAGSDGSVGFFLLACVTTHACSSYYLARRCLPPSLQVPFTTVATISGPVVNLIWANNFDHLLALSIAPALIGYTIELDFTRKRQAIFFGASVAVMVYIYPEMAPILLLPAGLILISRAYQEKVGVRGSFSAALVAFGVVLVPMSAFIYKFMVYQFGTVGRAAALRPGNGYFPTLLDFHCFYGAASGLYAPFQPCQSAAIDILKFNIGQLVAGLVLAGILVRRDAIALAGIIIVSAAMYFIFKQSYDYGAFKILTSGSPVFALLAASALIPLTSLRASIGAGTAALLLLVTAAKIISFDKTVNVKSLAIYAELNLATPHDAIVALKLADPSRFQWAAYYLRDRQTVPVEGRFIYLEPTVFDTPRFNDRQTRATHILTDSTAEGELVWSNQQYKLYRAKR